MLTTPEAIALNRHRFPLGKIVATPGALAALAEAMERPYRFLEMHARGEWGNVEPEDADANERALAEGERVLSSYRTAEGERIWIITEWDRSVTTILLPGEY